MRIKGINRSSSYIYIPIFAITEDGKVLNSSGLISELLEEEWVDCTQFDLPEEKWFAWDEGQIVRWPKDKEWDWRTEKAKEIISNINQHGNPEIKLKWVSDAAKLCSINLEEFIDKLKSTRKNNEDLITLFNNIKNTKKQEEAERRERPAS
jgi:hypothetical protein